MIVYFADRRFNILGQASTGLPSGLTIFEDKKVEEVETGVASFEFDVLFDKNTRSKIEAWAEVGNYVLRSNKNDAELYTIIDVEIDTKDQTVHVYAEDAGLDLLNEVVGEYEADKAYNINHYIETFAYDSGFRVKINEAAGLTKKLSWSGEETVTARLASVASQFDGCEISFSFAIKGLKVTNKYINIYKKRGQDLGVTLRLNKEIDNIITTKSIANVATALRCTGGTPEGEDDPITLRGKTYDDGDFHIDGDTLKSRTALKKWSRYMWPDEPNQQVGHEGHIVKLFSYETTSKDELLSLAIAELTSIRDMEVNFEAEITKLPDNVRIGDRVNIVDEAGELFLSTRLLKLTESAANKDCTVVLGEHLIRESGIHQKVIDLAAKFAESARSAAKALSVANAAKDSATKAQTQVEEAGRIVEAAQTAVNEAADSVEEARQAATDASNAASDAQAAADSVENSISSIANTVTNAQQAASNAATAASTAQQKADEASHAAAQAAEYAAEANAVIKIAQTAAATAAQKAEEATTAADAAKVEAGTAKATAEAAKLDAARAAQDIASLGDNLDTISHTMAADYSRKTDLTESEARLQSQIQQNAAGISSVVSHVQKIDETSNNAQELLQGAIKWAEEALAKANTAQAEAQAAQNAADSAATAAANAQAEAEAAQAAADSAREVLDAANIDLADARADLATVQGRADATEDEIAAAQEAVEAAQAAANQASVNATQAIEEAAEAQEVAHTALAEATYAQEFADRAASDAKAARNLADEAEGNAAEAQRAANVAIATAEAAQEAANTAVADAISAKETADQLKAQATTAEKSADAASAKADQAAAYLVTAEARLAELTASAEATEEEIAKAQEDVDNARIAANTAQAEALDARDAAIAALENAFWAQEEATDAQSAADRAQAEAEAAQKAADEARAAVDGLAVRTENAETAIRQNTKEISLRATKTELSQTISDIESVAESVSYMQIQAGEISASVQAVEKTTKDSLEALGSSVDALTQEVSAKMSAEAVEVQIRTAMENGTEKVVTSTGYTFDEEGLTIEKSGSEMKTQITDNGMTVYQQDVEVLVADNRGVGAKNLHATTYLIVGSNSRFEDYGNGRTGCFWIGGTS